MECLLDLEKLDVMKLARSIELDCQEAVKWERRKLDWILNEQRIDEERLKTDAA